MRGLWRGYQSTLAQLMHKNHQRPICATANALATTYIYFVVNERSNTIIRELLLSLWTMNPYHITTQIWKFNSDCDPAHNLSTYTIFSEMIRNFETMDISTQVDCFSSIFVTRVSAHEGYYDRFHVDILMIIIA